MDANTTLIPITKLKIPMQRWLETPIKYEDNLFVEDIIEMMSEKVYQWIQEREDLHVIKDYDSFNEEFINLLYDKYLDGRR